jgi:hypothetical protein
VLSTFSSIIQYQNFNPPQIMHDAEVVPATNCQTNWIHEPVSPVAGGISKGGVCNSRW